MSYYKDFWQGEKRHGSKTDMSTEVLRKEVPQLGAESRSAVVSAKQPAFSSFGT